MELDQINSTRDTHGIRSGSTSASSFDVGFDVSINVAKLFSLRPETEVGAVDGGAIDVVSLPTASTTYMNC